MSEKICRFDNFFLVRWIWNSTYFEFQWRHVPYNLQINIHLSLRKAIPPYEQ